MHSTCMKAAEKVTAAATAAAAAAATAIAASRPPPDELVNVVDDERSGDVVANEVWVGKDVAQEGEVGHHPIQLELSESA
jgi:hypothetical protein